MLMSSITRPQPWESIIAIYLNIWNLCPIFGYTVCKFYEEEMAIKVGLWRPSLRIFDFLIFWIIRGTMYILNFVNKPLCMFPNLLFEVWTTVTSVARRWLLCWTELAHSVNSRYVPWVFVGLANIRIEGLSSSTYSRTMTAFVWNLKFLLAVMWNWPIFSRNITQQCAYSQQVRCIIFIAHHHTQHTQCDIIYQFPTSIRLSVCLSVCLSVRRWYSWLCITEFCVQ